MSVLVPFGALEQFNLAVDMREVAAHYGVKWRLLRHSNGRSAEKLALAWDALAWKLAKQRQFSIQRVADLLQTTKATAQAAVARHAQRIAQFRATFATASAPEEAADATK